MKNLIAIIFFVFVFSNINLIAQNREFTDIKKNKEYTTKSGLKMIFYTVNDKFEFADSGDVVSVHYIGKFTDGKSFDASYDHKRPLEFALGTGRVIKGWDEALTYMHKGDSAMVTIPPNLAYGEADYASIPGNSTLIFTMKMVEIQKPARPYNVAGLDTTYAENGLKYIIVQKGKGAAIKDGNRAKVKYSGYFLDGRKFDSSFDHPGAEDFDFILGRHQVIEGWEKGVLGMKEGEKRQLIIPYMMAYGEAGRSPVIPPQADLVFDVELAGIEMVQLPIPYDVIGKDTQTTSTGLKYIKTKTTNNRQVVIGDTITVEYSGYFADGKLFDSSVERGDSIMLIVGKGMVIRGWDEGLLLMKKGEKARLIIPYFLAYGEEGRMPVIPPKADLIFDVYLKNVGFKN